MPLVPKLKYYDKDDWDFLKKLPRILDPNFTFLMPNMVSLDISILPKLGLRGLFYYITKYKNLTPIIFSKEFILEGAEFVLKNNFISLEEIFN